MLAGLPLGVTQAFVKEDFSPDFWVTYAIHAFFIKP